MAGVAIAALAALRWLDVNPVDITPWQPIEDAPMADGAWASIPDRSAIPGSDEPGPAPWIWIEDSREDGVRGGDSGPGGDGPRPFDSNDWGAAWLNLLEQESGAAHRADSAVISRLLEPSGGERRGDAPGAVPAFGVVVVGPGLAAGLDETGHRALERYVDAGGVLVLDRPPAGLAPLSGVRWLDGERALPSRGRFEISLEADLDSGDRFALDLPLPTRFRPALPEEDVRVVARLGGEVAILERRVGRGVVQTFAFDLPRFLVAMQQGTPSDDRYGLAKRFGKYDWLIEPEDVVVDAMLLDNPVPFADVVEELIAARWCRRVPQARFWRFPDARPGAFLMTHDEDLQGGASTLPMAEHESSEGLTSTFFLIPHPRIHETWKEPADYYRTHEELGADLQLHWNVLPMPGGFWKVEPWLRRYPIERQIAFLELDLARPFANRTHYLILGGHYTRSFRLLQREGIRWDTTYGPNRGGRGYLFGTGLPYRPLDTNGQPFDLHEVPFVTQEDWGEASPEFLARLLRESAELYHQIVIPIFHPHLIILEPEGEAFWKGSYRAARDSGAWITDFAGLDRFWSERSASRSQSRWNPNEGVLEAAYDARGDGLSLRLPPRTAAGPLLRVRVGVREAAVSRMDAPGGEVVLVPVDRGRGSLKAEYGPR